LLAQFKELRKPAHGSLLKTTIPANQQGKHMMRPAAATTTAAAAAAAAATTTTLVQYAHADRVDDGPQAFGGFRGCRHVQVVLAHEQQDACARRHLRMDSLTHAAFDVCWWRQRRNEGVVCAARPDLCCLRGGRLQRL
jgi:hypothetical protein